MATSQQQPPELTATPSSEDSIVMVLLVDDQMMIGEAVRRALANYPNIDFHYCTNSSQALEVAVEVKPTVILQDLVMPGIDGLTLVREYRANPVTKDIPIIVLSTTEDPQVKSAAFATGANDYIVKLPDQIELVARIRYHSQAYLNQLQRDAAYRALRDSQRQLMEMNFELQRLTNVDGLTGLSNRRYFDECLDAEWKRSTRGQNSLAVLMIDIDFFKEYNDTYGHLAGDEALQRVAEVLQKSSGRSTDLVARFGGEEFVIMLPITDLAGAQLIAEKARQDVEDMQLPNDASTASKFLTVSIGVSSIIPQRSQAPFVVVDAADTALYEAKKTGKNRVSAST